MDRGTHTIASWVEPLQTARGLVEEHDSALSDYEASFSRFEEEDKHELLYDIKSKKSHMEWISTNIHVFL